MLSKIPNAGSFVVTTTPDLAEVDEDGISTRRLFTMLGVGGALFWAGLGYLVYLALI